MASLSVPSAAAFPACGPSAPRPSSSCAGNSAACPRRPLRVSAPSSGSRRGLSSLVAMASPQSSVEGKNQDLSEKISRSIKDAEEACAGGLNSGECAAAWDEVEELSSTAAHQRVKAESDKDPLEQFCKDTPEADECRVYED